MRPGKRVVDFFAGLGLALLSFPLLVALAFWSAISFRAWPFFVQERVGLGGKPVRCFKIRTLCRHTPAYLDKEELVAQGHERRLAATVRKTHLDELPQFWQVVAGTFSLVGPRPMIASIVDRMPADVAERRHSVRPGITGPWQVSVDGSFLLDHRCDYDLAYVEHASWRIDASIIWWTTAQALGASEKPKRDVFALMKVAPDESPVWSVGATGADGRWTDAPAGFHDEAPLAAPSPLESLSAS